MEDRSINIILNIELRPRRGRLGRHPRDLLAGGPLVELIVGSASAADRSLNIFISLDSRSRWTVDPSVDILVIIELPLAVDCSVNILVIIELPLTTDRLPHVLVFVALPLADRRVSIFR